MLLVVDDVVVLFLMQIKNYAIKLALVQITRGMK